MQLRLLDRTFGPNLLRVLGRVRRPRQLPQAPARIGVMKSTGIGDMILASAVARDIAAAFPASEVVLIGGPDNVDLARLVEGVSVLALPTAQPWAALPLLRSQRLDVLVDLGQWSRLEAIYAALSRARWTAGFETEGQRRHLAYDVAVRHSSEVPEIENFRALVRTLGIEATRLPHFPVPGRVRPPAPAPYVVFHLWPGGFRSELREWPAERWRDLARRLRGEGVSVVLTGGPGDVARTERFIATGAEPAPGITSVAGRYRLSELVDVLAQASCVVSVNTGVMHLAAAVGTETIALNGPTSGMRWGPIGPRVSCVDSDLPGCGYLNLGFEYDGQRTDCMHGISVERVAAAALAKLHG